MFLSILRFSNTNEYSKDSLYVREKKRKLQPLKISRDEKRVGWAHASWLWFMDN